MKPVAETAKLLGFDIRVRSFTSLEVDVAWAAIHVFIHDHTSRQTQPLSGKHVCRLQGLCPFNSCSVVDPSDLPNSAAPSQDLRDVQKGTILDLTGHEQ